MDILGTIRMYIYNKILGGRKLVETSVIERDVHHLGTPQEMGPGE